MKAIRFEISLPPERRRALEELAGEVGMSSADLARLHVLAYNLTRVMNIIGVKPLNAANGELCSSNLFNHFSGDKP